MNEESSERGLDRLVTFLDAVVAIAITLLVLPLVELASDAGEAESLGEVLDGHAYEFVAFFLSFYVISQLWRVHHSIAKDMKAYDEPFVTLSLLWALTIAFLPFPTALLGPLGHDPGVMLLYFGSMIAGSLCHVLITWHVDRTPALVREGVTPRSWHSSAATTIIMVVAMALALLIPAVNYWGLLLLRLSSPLARLLRRVHE